MFQSEKIAPKTYRIMGRGSDCYLLEGDNESIMIDSGCDHENIQKYAQSLTHNPVRSVINTHSHFDHTGGNGYFEKIFVTEKMIKTCKQCMDEDHDKYLYDYNFTLVKDLQLIPLQGRELLILECDCHSPGNIVILDRKERLLFVGDELDKDQILLLPGFAEKPGQFQSVPASTVSDYLKMLYRINEYIEDFDYICTGHNGSPLDKSVINIMIELCIMILNNQIETSLNCESETYLVTDPHYPYQEANYCKATFKGYSLVYCNDDLVDRSNNSKSDPITPLHKLCAENYKFKI